MYHTLILYIDQICTYSDIRLHNINDTCTHIYKQFGEPGTAIAVVHAKCRYINITVNITTTGVNVAIYKSHCLYIHDLIDANHTVREYHEGCILTFFFSTRIGVQRLNNLLLVNQR